MSPTVAASTTTINTTITTGENMNVEKEESVHIITNNHQEQLIGILCTVMTRSSNIHENSPQQNHGSQNNKKPIAVLCHGLACHKNYFIFPRMESNEYDTFRFDFSGNGESDGEFSYANYHKEVEDLHCVINYLKEKLNYSKISIIGHSKGGNVVLQYASKYPQELQHGVVVNISGRFDMSKTPMNRFSESERHQLENEGIFLWKVFTLEPSLCVRKKQEITTPTNNEEGLTRRYYVTKEALQERESLNTKIEFNLLYPLKLYSIHGDNDDVIPFQDSQEFHEFLLEQMRKRNLIDRFSHQVICVKGANHFFAGHYETLIGILKDLLAKE
ncbi:hypothetical protein FDP41_010382 [Naegleria fowleri]|uniref:Serine aminopeptidase S33 domain-containing protein n=1 Tax=Naegleria fowleri TaxID=5763 RepID=A0A6A5C1K9_NAEFO|nr:uncharacterized protein FDP41_010382 [Naegleria fowleri]KAF0983317.1 hypothetical protein FDP41_010382 [Naegleria fowleri]